MILSMQRFLPCFLLLATISLNDIYAAQNPIHSISSKEPVTIQIFGVNDFHGQITTGRRVNDRPAGSAPVLASYIREAERGKEDATLIALIGDQLGASPPASSLLLDEPALLIFNSLANANCSSETRLSPKCNIVGTIGNHEFDRTPKTMFELLYGRDTPPTDHWIDLPKFPGTNFPFVSANIVDATTGKTLFPPYIIKQVKGISVAFIGAILKEAPDVILPKNIENIKFLDEASSINHYLPEIKAQGVDVIVVLIHQGGKQAAYEGPTKDDTQIEGPIVDIVSKLDSDVDLVMSAHTHNFTNGFLKNQAGKKILVTQANSYGTSFADVTLTVDAEKHMLMNESAEIITTYADKWPGTSPDIEAAKLVKLAEQTTDPIVKNQIGILDTDLLRKQNDSGESNSGDFVADAAKYAMKTQIAFYQPGGIRADLFTGNITWGDVYAIAPFSNPIVKLNMTGNDIYDLLEQQWTLPTPIILQTSGLRYVYDLKNPVGQRVISITCNGQPLEREKTYSVATVMFLAFGGDGFSVMKKEHIVESSVLENESLVNYVKSFQKPFSVAIDGRILKE